MLISIIKKKLYRKAIHRLVAEYFIPNPENKPEVNHKNGKKYDNKVSNLEWVTPKENTNHAFETSLRKVHCGEGSTDSKITTKQAMKICQLLEKNEKGTREIAEEIGVSFAIVSNIKHKKAWVEVSQLYDIDKHTVKSKPKKSKRKKATKITEFDVIKICEFLQNTDLSVDQISSKLNITKCKINAVLYGSAWTFISCNYDFNNRRKR